MTSPMKRAQSQLLNKYCEFAVVNRIESMLALNRIESNRFLLWQLYIFSFWRIAHH